MGGSVSQTFAFWWPLQNQKTIRLVQPMQEMCVGWHPKYFFARRGGSEANQTCRYLFICCIMLQVFHTPSIPCSLLMFVQLLSGRQLYCWIKRVVHVISAINEGMEPFQTSDIADVNDSHKRYSLRCLSRDFRSRPGISEIVEFLATAE